MVTDPSKNPDIKAICFLKKDGDMRNCVYFSLDELTITIKGRSHKTPLSQVKSITLGTRKLLGPIVAGGIIFPLSSLAMIGNFGNTFFYMMILSILGIFLLIFGFNGSPAISVITSGGTHHYFIPRMGINIENFISYFNSGRYLDD